MEQAQEAETVESRGRFGLSKRQWGFVALLISILLWGPNPVITILTLKQFPPFSLGLLRLALAAALVTIVFAPRGYLKIERRDFPVFILIGILGSSLNMALFLYGIQYTTAITSQTIFSATPVFTSILAFVILKERIRPLQFVGVGIGLVGALLVALREYFETGSFDGGSLYGNGFIFLALISWVAYILISKNISERYSAFTIASVAFLIGFVSFIPLAVWENRHGMEWVASVNIYGIIGVVYQGAIASSIAFVSYQVGLKLTSAFAAGVVLYLGPVITALVAVPILGERITLPFLAGAAFIIGGSFLATQHEVVTWLLRRRE